MVALRYIAIGFVTAVLVVVALWSGGLLGSPRAAGTGDIEPVEITGETFHLTVAADRESIERGLMFKEEIKPNEGVFFIFPGYRTHAFWMKNCLVDIDLIFLDEIGRVIALHEMKVEPEQREGETEAEYEARLTRYASGRPARFAIEVKSGTIDRLGVAEGDLLDLDLPRLKRMSR